MRKLRRRKASRRGERRAGDRHDRRRRPRFVLELVESRLLLSASPITDPFALSAAPPVDGQTIFVTTDADSGAGSLREAIRLANADTSTAPGT